MNDIDQQLESLKKTMIEIDNYQSFTNSLFKNLAHKTKLLEDNNIIMKRSDWTEHTFSATHILLFKDYTNGTLAPLKTSHFNINDSDRIEAEIKNRIYQLLLLNAFEAFEAYLKNANLLLNKLENVNGFSPTKFIVKLHNTIPVVSLIIKIRNESDSSRFLDELNLFLTFSLIEQLRHQITHTSGYAKNKSDFIDKWLRRIGSYRNGRIESEAMNYLDYYFGANEYENWVCLTEVSDKDSQFRYDDRLGALVRELTSYIIFIHMHIKSASNVVTSSNPFSAPSA